MAEDSDIRSLWFCDALDTKDEKCLIDLLMFNEDDELDSVRTTLEDNPWILPRVCVLGYDTVLHTILGHRIIDINTKYNGKTGLQYACENGHSHIVRRLLLNGASLKKNLWEEDSEFYAATINGHQDVVEILYHNEPGLAAEPSVRYCLMYAACRGGHLPLVHKWLTPGIDINKQIDLVTDLDNCENQYPLYAACQGEHLEVARFLVLDLGAAITKEICRNFPRFTVQLIRSLCQSSILSGRQTFTLSKLNIECILPCWFYTEGGDFLMGAGDSSYDDEDEEEDMTEIVIELAHNRLRELPDGVLWSLRKLTSLDVSHNPLCTINHPFHSASLMSNRITILNLSHCQLKSISSHIFSLPSLMELDLSHNKLTTIGTNEDWKCKNLVRFYVSHNLLTTLPQGIHACCDMEDFDASNNELTTTCAPWQCPLKFLDLSHNKLEVFPPSADQFWTRTLKKLKLDHNMLDELAQSIVKLRQLVHLDLSENKIQNLPSPEHWKCPLVYLNMSENQLGAGKAHLLLQRSVSMRKPSPSHLVFPSSCLSKSMVELYLARNDLKAVPEGVCDMINLSVLDLTENSRITSLPEDLGKLSKLLVLKLAGITLKDKELQNLVVALRDNKQGDVMAADIVTYLEKKRRNCDRPNMLKMVVLGCKNRSGYCLVQKLVKSKKSKDAETSEHENLTVSQWIFTPGGRRLLTPLNKKPVSVEIWEFPDIKVTSAILPCFLTLNSLYLIMHDVGSYGSNLHAVSEKISSIEACVLRPHIIVVCTYIDTAERNRLDSEIKAKAVEKEFFNTIFVSVTFGSNESVEMLRQEISAVWETMRDAAYERAHNLHERQVPSKFFDVTKKVKQLKSNICTMEEFLQNVDCTKKDLEDGIDKHLKLHEFLLQIGAMLHYDIQMEKLSEFVILDPAWLFEVLCKFLKSLTKRRHNIAQLPIGTVQRQVQSMLPHEDYFPPFLKILEAFNIGVRIRDGQGKEILLIPSLLSKRPPQFQLDTERDGVQAARLYRLPAISPALWSHVISQLSSAFERLSTTKWKLGERSSLPGGTFDKTKSFRMTCKPSMQGLHVTNKNKQYWRTGIMINHDHGYVVVEEVECTSSSSPGKVESAILVTVQTKMSDDGHDEEDQRMENLKRLSVIGIVRDELEEVLELFNPKFRDPSEMQFKPYALCPLCYKITPGSGSIDVSNLHFSVRDCAQMVLFRDTILCSRGPVLLEQLVPEFLFLELPSQMCLSHNDIELFDEKLGHGMAGTVTKGKYKGTEVAIKVFHKPTLEPPSLRDVMYPNIGDVSAEHRNSRIRLDQLETEQSKISSAFSEVRREVGILSKLSHKCIVTFIGVCVQPHLLLVMELAAHGSLRSELKKRSETHHGQQHTENTLISQMVFSKDLTYRMILQIGCGLAYLHKNNIIYRDLKPDNILVISLEVEDPINVKLSDYGISKFGTLQGLSGMFGTVGYMAPEVMSKQVYTEKVDIYSFAIVMLEILTGIPPLEQDQRPLVSLMTGDSSTPVHIQGHKIQCNFPCLEILMSECWSPWMGDRPSAEEVVTKMKAEHFLLLHSCIWLEDNNPKLEVTCIYACETAGRWNVWISESGPGSHRFFSVYDVESSCFTVNRKPLPGPRVISMTKVGVRIWLACQDVDTLQIVVRGHQNKFDIVPGETLEAKPTKLLHHSFEASEVGEGFIIAGLANGSVTAYHFKNAHRTTVKTVTSIELNSSFEIACMCSVNPSLVAVGCGMKVFFLNVGFYNAEKTDGSSKQILTVPELINFGSVSLNDILDHHEPVDSMAAEGNSVWCSLENCPYMIQIDTDHKKIMHILTLSWDPTCDTVRLEEKGETSADPHSRQVAVEIGQGLAASEDGHEVRRSDVSHNSDVIEISENQNMAYQQGFKKCATLPGHRESAAVSFEEVVCDKQALSDEDGETDEESARTVYYMIEPGMFSAPKDETRLSRSVDISRTPPVPPRAPFSRRAIREKARSMPDLQLPPPLPKRKSHREKDLAVTSIALSSDVLIVGTNCGGCLFIPFTYINTSDKAGIIHPLPHQYPVLRHPESNAETCGRKRSYTSNSLSQVSVQSQPQTSTGSISALTLANHRLISLHSVCDQVCRRRQSSRDTYDDRRQASLFPAEVAERLNCLNISEDDFIHENAENPSEVFLDPARPVSGISQQSLLSRVDQLQLTEVADIAIWDEISCQRLATVQAYGESMSV